MTYSATHQRRYEKAQQSAGFTEIQFRDLCGYYGYVCLCCGEQRKLTADHVIPLSRGGTNDIDNIQPLCRSCNTKKGTKTVDYRKTTVRRVIQHSFF